MPKINPVSPKPLIGHESYDPSALADHQNDKLNKYFDETMNALEVDLEKAKKIREQEEKALADSDAKALRAMADDILLYRDKLDRIIYDSEREQLNMKMRTHCKRLLPIIEAYIN
jgi:molecular chaperone GrpE (heat shock protein)